MILFDNIYYLLYNYFMRTNSGKYGYKATASVVSGFYFYFCICIFYCLTMILYYMFLIDDNVSDNLNQHITFLINDNTFVILSVIINICIQVRYYAFKNIKEINEKISDMDMNKRERLNILTVSYMVASPFLLFFLANYVKDLCR
jgi:hypothetical protein